MASTEASATNGTAAPAITQGINAGPDEVGKKVFVGNLAFATTADELKQLFSEIGNIKDAQIITRNTRSLGYGFVTFDSADDATSAITKFDKHSLGDRTINVELAKPDRADKVAKAAAKAAGLTPADAEGVGQGGADGAAPKKRRNPRKPRNARAPRADGEADGEADGPSAEGDEAAAPGAGTGAPRKRKSRAKKALQTALDGAATTIAGSTGSATAGTATAAAAGSGVGRRNTRAPRAKSTQGPPSENKIFVANLPFAVDNAGLSKLFTDAGFEVGSARVATRRVYPKAPKRGEGEAVPEGEEGEKPKRPAPFTRSRGFGFVTLKDHEQQDRALKELNGKEIRGEGEETRAVQLKVANERIFEEEGEGATAEGTTTGEKPAQGSEVAAA